MTAGLPWGPDRRAGYQLSPTLSELQRRILEFERGVWQSPGAKERQILETFQISPTRYYQLLNELIDRPAAAQADPALVARLRRRRTARARLRSSRPD